MNKIILLFSLNVFANVFALDIKEAVDLALKNNKNLILLKKDIDRAKMRLKIAYSEAYPCLNFKESLQWIDKEKTYSNSISLLLTQYLFKKAIFLNIREKRYDLEIAELFYKASEIDVIMEVAKKYIGLLELIEEEKVAKARIDYLEDLFLITEKRFNEGLILDIDVKEAFFALKEARIKHKMIKEKIEIEKEMISLLIGIPSLSIKPKDVLVFKPIDLKENENIALENRVEIKREMVLLEKSKLSPSIIKARLFPSVSLKGEYSWNANKESLSEAIKEIKKESDWSISLLCEIPIFDGGALYNEIKASKLSIEQQRITLEKIKDEVMLDVKNAKSILNNALETLELKKENLSLQEERLRITNELFNKGRRSLKDVLEEENRRNNANLDYILQIADYETKKLDYYKSLGILLEYFKKTIDIFCK